MKCNQTVDCRARVRGNCTALVSTCFPGGGCPFAQSRAAHRAARQDVLRRLTSLGRQDLIVRYGSGMFDTVLGGYPACGGAKE